MSITFQNFGLREELLRSLNEAGYEEPTPIQEMAIPVILEGRDLIGVAQTGTGKTLAYLLPILHRMEPDALNPRAVAVCPTRELAIQVAGEAERFSRHLGTRVLLAYGGVSSGGQKQSLREGCDLLVATPGRLLDFVNSAWLSLRDVGWFVLDEADRMLDMGFINDMDAILRRAPMSRQTLLFSATFPDPIRNLSERYMLHPEMVRVDPGPRVKDTVEHALYPVLRKQKGALLVEILRRERPKKVLIFSATREGTSDLALRLRRANHEVVSLSSLLSQSNRERVMEAYRRGEYPILVATDVAARGLDITDIDMVVNYDAPMHPEDYVHRIGRTGRAARSGKAVTLVTELDGRRVAEIERLLGEPVPRVRLAGFAYQGEPDLVAGERRRRHDGGHRRGGPRRGRPRRGPRRAGR